MNYEIFIIFFGKACDIKNGGIITVHEYSIYTLASKLATCCFCERQALNRIIIDMCYACRSLPKLLLGSQIRVGIHFHLLLYLKLRSKMFLTTKMYCK